MLRKTYASPRDLESRAATRGHTGNGGAGWVDSARAQGSLVTGQWSTVNSH